MNLFVFYIVDLKMRIKHEYKYIKANLFNFRAHGITIL